MSLSNIEISLNRILLSNINTASFIIDYSKHINQTKLLVKKCNTLLKIIIITKKPYLLYSANCTSIIL